MLSNIYFRFQQVLVGTPVFITLFRAIIMLCGTDIIPWNIFHIRFRILSSVPQNIVMDMNIVTVCTCCTRAYEICVGATQSPTPQTHAIMTQCSCIFAMCISIYAHSPSPHGMSPSPLWLPPSMSWLPPPSSLPYHAHLLHSCPSPFRHLSTFFLSHGIFVGGIFHMWPFFD